MYGSVSCLKFYREQDDKELSISFQDHKPNEHGYLECPKPGPEVVVFLCKESSSLMGQFFPASSEELSKLISDFVKGKIA